MAHDSASAAPRLWRVVRAKYAMFGQSRHRLSKAHLASPRNFQPFAGFHYREREPSNRHTGAIMMKRNSLVAFIAGALVGTTLVLTTTSGASAPVASRSAIEDSPLSDQQKAVHLLNRLAYGPHPDDVERVKSMGFGRFIEQQLNPAKISDSHLEPRLADLETTHMSVRELAQLFPRGGIVKRLVEAGKLDEKHLFKNRFAGANQRGRNTSDEPSRRGNPPSRAHGVGDSGGRSGEEAAGEEVAAESMRPGPEMTMAAGRWRGRGNPIYRPITKLPEPLELPGRLGRRRPPLLGVNPQNLIVGQLQAAKLIRAVHSERQLEEVMTDFWMNHFNVFIGKGPERLLVPAYERNVIRPRVFGKFRDLLWATAKSPAMLVYLDNIQSVSPDSRFGQRRNRGLNENYARELMELHTLGVDGGYTQQDVIEVAKVFTGWMVPGGPGGGAASFRFQPAAHAPGDKKVLGRTIPEAGVQEGEEVLDLLAEHPSTAKFLATKLVRRFVADDPPPSLVGKVAETYTATGGDVRAMLRTIFYSPEFWSSEAFQAKAKKPLEFVASSIRAVGGELTPTPMLLGAMQRLGEPLYLCQPPTGYPDMAEEWLNTGTLLFRWNFALGLASGKLPGVKIPAPDALDPQEASAVLARLSDDFLHGEMSSETQAKIEGMLEEQLAERRRPGAPLRSREVRYIAGLVLGSPEFQRR